MLDRQSLEKCMHEANIKDEQTMLMIFEDEKGQFAEETCLRKCLYTAMGVLKDDGTENVG